MSISKSEAGRLGGIAWAKSAIILKAERIAEYDKNPKLCAQCQLPLSYEEKHKKFHNRSCAGSFTGKFFPKRKKKLVTVVKLSKEQVLMNRFEIGGVSERPTLKNILIKLHGRKCSICGNTHWMNTEIPIELDHIDGDAGNNMPSNLRLLCPNCHALTPTAKGKNRGNGRKSRGLPLH